MVIRNTTGIMGTKRQRGSNYAFKYMTVCVTAQKEHVTLAGSYMTQLMKEVDERTDSEVFTVCERESSIDV